MKKIIIVSLLSLTVLSSHAQSVYWNDVKKNAVCKIDPNMPANAVPAWPKTAYVPVGDPSCPPCYEYTSKRGLKVMECPFLFFPPENNNNIKSGPERVTGLEDRSNNWNNDLDVQSNRSYTGNYPKACVNSPDMPANAVPVWPKSAYIPFGNPDCAPCYEYTTKSGIRVMECPGLYFTPVSK